MKLKVCKGCSVEKSLDYYSWAKDKRTPSGGSYRAYCNACRADAARDYHRNNPGKRKLYQDNYHRLNKVKWSGYGSKRRAVKIKATPPWLTKEQLKEIENFYRLRDDVNILSDFEYQVDHIVPLQGENVCGLHVPWNLQLLPKEDNLAKSNSTRDYPHSWLY